MKTLLTIILGLMILAGCKKSSTMGCYECAKSDGKYYDVGCYTENEWSSLHASDSLNAPCRKK